MPLAPSTTPRLLIVGGGVAAIEALLAVHAQELGDAIQIELVSSEETFRLPPLFAVSPFGRGHADPLPLAEVAAEHGATFRQALVASIDAPRNVVVLQSGEELSFDALIVAVGATPVRATDAGTPFEVVRPESVSGVASDIEEGWASSVAVVIPDAPSWPLPGYEIALQLAARARAAGLPETPVHLFIPTDRPVPWLGEGASSAVLDALAGGGVQLHAGEPARVVRSGVVERGRGLPEIRAERILVMPRLVGPALPGLTLDEDGFITVGGDARVEGLLNIWAAGDGTTQPVKFGGLACHYADVAAAEALRALGWDQVVTPEQPVLHARLVTGDGEVALSNSAEQEAPEGGWVGGAKIAGRYLTGFLESRGHTHLVQRSHPDSVTR